MSPLRLYGPKNTMYVLSTVLIVCSCSVMMPSAKFVNPGSSWGHSVKPNDFIEDGELAEKIVFEGDIEHTDYFKILMEDGENILFGARNKVFNISLVTLQEDLERSIDWLPLQKDKNGCNQRYADMADKDKCENFIRVLGKVDDGKFIVCGTNAFKPKCQIYIYREGNLPIQVPGFHSIAEQDGRGNCPFDPDHNSTFVYTDGQLFSATVADFYDVLIMENKTKIRTKQKDSTLLNDPDFVSSFEIDDKIYFLFRETAVEHMNCGKARFSRVARVCKKDVGMSGNNEGDLEWTSFFKARLNCSIPGDIPFLFNELQSSTGFNLGNYMATGDTSNRTRMFYGVFNTPENSIHGSAVCGFTLEDIERAFRGNFKEQKENHFKWQAVKKEEIPLPHPATVCMNNSKDIPAQTKAFISKHSLLDSAVNTAGGTPVLVQTHGRGRFSAVAVDWQVRAADHLYYDVVFVGTTDGKVIKSVNVGRDGNVKTVVIEEIQVLGRHETVKELRIFKHGFEGKIIVVSKEKIVSIPLYRCNRQTLCGDCVALQDPYCAWQPGSCETFFSKGIQSVALGDTSKCPDGGVRGTKTTISTSTTARPVTDIKTECPVCTCDCRNQTQAQSESLDSQKGLSDLDNASSTVNDPPGIDIQPASSAEKPCAAKEIKVRGDDQIYTASTLAVACVIAIVVAALIGFVIGYRVSLCRNNTQNTEQMINYEQTFGSLRKHSNRHSMDTTPNIYYEPGTKPYSPNQKIQNVLVSNNISQKNPNLPNGTIENKTIPSNQASKTYL